MASTPRSSRHPRTRPHGGYYYESPPHHDYLRSDSPPHRDYYTTDSPPHHDYYRRSPPRYRYDDGRTSHRHGSDRPRRHRRHSAGASHRYHSGHAAPPPPGPQKGRGHSRPRVTSRKDNWPPKGTMWYVDVDPPNGQWQQRPPHPVADQHLPPRNYLRTVKIEDLSSETTYNPCSSLCCP